MAAEDRVKGGGADKGGGRGGRHHGLMAALPSCLQSSSLMASVEARLQRLGR